MIWAINKLNKRAVKRYLYFLSGTAIFIIAVTLFFPNIAQAAFWDIVTDPVGSVILLLANIVIGIASFFGKIILTLIGIMVEVAQFNNFIDAPAVAKGWVIVRDVMNMFFIVVLLLIAFGSVFRIEEYQYKKILGKLLIMAVLINFSKSICGFFIDISQVVMLTFVNGFKEAAAGNFVSGFHLEAIFQFANADTTQAERYQGDPMMYLQAALMALGTIVITAVVVLVYLVVFLLRIIALWFLIIISPVAYALAAFPGDAKKYSSQWWDYFGKYVTTGPILAFFLWLSLAVMQMGTSALGDFKVSNSAYEIPAAGITQIGTSEVLLSFIINIMLLMGGLWMTQQLGVAGGKLAATAMNKIQGAGASIARAPLKAVALPVGFAAKRVWGSTKLGYSKLTGKLMEGTKQADGSIKESGKVKKTMWTILNAPAATRGWAARTTEMEKEQKEISDAYGREVTEQFRTGGKLKMPYSTFVERKHENEYMKDYQNMSKEAFMKAAVDLDPMQGIEAERRKRAIVKAAMSQGYVDDLLRTPYFAKKYALGNVVNNEKTNHRFYYGYMGRHQQTYRMLDEDADALARAVNHPEYMGHAQKNAITGAYEDTMEEVPDGAGNVIDLKQKVNGQADYVISEWNKLGGRDAAKAHIHSELDQVAERYDKDTIGADGRMYKKGDFVVDKDGAVAVKWGIGENGRTEFQKSITGGPLSSGGVLGESKHSSSRTVNQLTAEEYDDQTHELVVHSQDDLRKIATIFEEAPARILKMFELKSKITNAQGFKVRLEKPDGTVESHGFGNYEAVQPKQIGIEIASDLKAEGKIKNITTNETGNEESQREQVIATTSNLIMAGKYASINEVKAAIKGNENAFRPPEEPKKPVEPTNKNTPDYKDKFGEYTRALGQYNNSLKEYTQKKSDFEDKISSLAGDIIDRLGTKRADAMDFDQYMKDAPSRQQPPYIESADVKLIQQTLRTALENSFKESAETEGIGSQEMSEYMVNSLSKAIDKLIQDNQRLGRVIKGEGDNRNLMRPQVIRRIVNSFLPHKSEPYNY